MTKSVVLTVGTSNLTSTQFVNRVQAFDVGCLVDVRSFPRSRHPHFNQPQFRACLNRQGISYLHLGDQLGGHVTDEEASYTRRSTMSAFLDGIGRVLDIAARCRPALCCAEGEVQDCHRFAILSRYLAERHDAEIIHILRDGRAETHAQTEDRLMHRKGLATDLFRDRSERLSAAYTTKLVRMGLRP